MAFKLAIAEVVLVTVKGRIKGEAKGKDKPFDFTLTMNRKDQKSFNEEVSSDGRVDEFIVANTTGWDGQRLVLNDDNTPAAFSEEALRALLNIAGMTTWVFQAYSRDLGVHEKN